MLHDHDVTSHQIKRAKLNTNRSIPALTKDYGMDDSKIADVAYDNNPDPSLSLRKQATLREAVHKLVHGTRKFSQLPIKCKAIIGIALMNEIVRGSNDELKKFPMWHRSTVKDVLVEVGGGKPVQYPCSGVLLDGRVTNMKETGDAEPKLCGYLADSGVIEVVKQNIMNQKDIKKKAHCQQVIQCFEDAMKAQIPTEDQLIAMKALFKRYNRNQGTTEMNKPQQQAQMDGNMDAQIEGGHESDRNRNE
eukprot:639246_1